MMGWVNAETINLGPTYLIAAMTERSRARGRDG